MTETESAFTPIEGSHVPMWRAEIDGVPVLIIGHPSRTTFMFSYRMNVVIAIKSIFFDSISECISAFEEQRKDMTWRRAKSYAAKNPPKGWTPDYQI